MTLRFVVAAVALSALLLGCGGADDEADPDGSASSSSSDPSTPPRTVPASTTGGSTTTPAPTTPPETAPAMTLPPSPGFLVPEDAGPWAMAVGERTSLRLDGARSWSEPVVEGDAVALIPVDFESNPGYTQYDIAARVAGEATITVDGDGQPYVITFIVT